VRTRLESERGQALVICLLFLGVLVGMAGMVIDVGAWYVTDRKAQAAADFGALAGVSELPRSPSAAHAVAADYVDENLPGATTKSVHPHDGGESDFPCTHTAAKFEFNRTPQTIPDGVYCATDSFKANGNNQTGNITVLAPEIVINGDNQRFTPYMDGLLFYATGTKELALDGNNFNWTGTIFHPRGRVKINGDQYSILNGLIEGLAVEVNGYGFTMNGTGPNTEDDITLLE
jgi:Flp pilus assembly protein TadG